MPSPFPGMDPYVEASLQTTFHHELSSEIARQLAPLLRPKYIARTAERFVVEEFDGVTVSAADIYPDANVTHVSSEPGSKTEAATIAAPLCLPTVMPQSVPHVSVEIYNVEHRKLVTAIEVLSPTNKRGKGRDEYLDKRREVLLSSAHLVEIDLLCEGARIPMQKPLPAARYFVFVTRANRRPMTDIWPIQLADPLPTVPIPLLRGDPDVLLNLGLAFQSIYDGLGFDLSLDYSRPPEISLNTDESQWLDRRLHEAGLRRA